MRRLRRVGGVWFCAGLPLLWSGCGGEAESGAGESPRAAPVEGAPAEAPPPSAPRGNAAIASSPLLNPRAPELNMMAPARFRARFTTSKGVFVIEAHRDWAPRGVDRFYNLVRNGFYDGTRFFRVLDGFVAQWGIHGEPRIQAHWRGANIADDPVVQSNTRGRVTFANAGPGTRSTQLFINYGDNSGLDARGFAPIGEIVQGMDVAERLYAGYGEGQPQGPGPYQAYIQARGNAYLTADFPNLDYIERAEIVAEN